MFSLKDEKSDPTVEEIRICAFFNKIVKVTIF